MPNIYGISKHIISGPHQIIGTFNRHFLEHDNNGTLRTYKIIKKQLHINKYQREITI